MTSEEYRATREALGLTQGELAARLGVTLNTISRRELGQVPITAEVELALQNALEGVKGKKTHALKTAQLREVAEIIGYEWAMLLGASDSDWNRAYKEADHTPIAVVHSHARTELVWLHGRCLYDCLFKNGRMADDVSIPLLFLTEDRRREWTNLSWAASVCPVMTDAYGRSNKKLFHVTLKRLEDKTGLPAYKDVKRELRGAFTACYSFMDEGKKQIFREGMDTYPGVSAFALSLEGRKK